ncbi:hypothetical protein [Streptomyces sp. NPDC126933]|uniref:hypothetical protein n=1 Tax=unclassified Streptomyces TaxID=2593676 RepID=UPI003665826F
MITEQAVRPTCRSLVRRLAVAAAAFGALALPLATAGPAQAATKDVHVFYYDSDDLGNAQYHVEFRGTVSPDGGSGYIVRGELDASCASGAATRQSVSLGYGSNHGAWEYKSFWCDDTPQQLNFRANRKSWDYVDFKVGATSRVFNLYAYGDKATYVIDDYPGK